MLNLQVNRYDRFPDFNELKDVISACQKCDLCQTRSNAVFGRGPVPSDLMIVGEAPGKDEDLQSQPFVGRSGKLLTQLLASVGINRETDCFIANIVKCRPPQNRLPKASEVEACISYLIQQIQLVQPKFLVCLGSLSLKIILNKKLSITKVRGKWYQLNVNYMTSPLTVVPCFHPAYLLRNPSNDVGAPKWQTTQDFKKIVLALV